MRSRYPPVPLIDQFDDTDAADDPRLRHGSAARGANPRRSQPSRWWTRSSASVSSNSSKVAIATAQASGLAVNEWPWKNVSCLSRKLLQLLVASNNKKKKKKKKPTYCSGAGLDLMF